MKKQSVEIHATLPEELSKKHLTSWKKEFKNRLRNFFPEVRIVVVWDTYNMAYTLNEEDLPIGGWTIQDGIKHCQDMANNSL